ncbi:hypothetical protein GCM10027035_22910 [Emticicia sediminis]
MFRFTQPKDNAVVATFQFLKTIGAKVTKQTVEETLRNHPDYPSLLATSDALNEWHIENVAVNLKPEQLTDLPTPFLASLNYKGEVFALVNSVKVDSVEWVHTEEGLKKEAIEDFLVKWNGIALLAETSEKSGEKNYENNIKKEFITNLRIPLLLVGVILMSISLFYFNFSSDWSYNVLLLTKFAGIIISSLLLWQSIDKNNPFIKNLCQVGGKANCNAILSSNSAQVTSWLSWSEVGFFYFTGSFFALLINPSSMFLLWILSSVALLYSFWSIYYQGFVAKQWCTLCLTVQLLFVIEFLLNENFLSELNIRFRSLTFINFFIFLQGLAIAILFWVFIKPILQKSQMVSPLKNSLKRFKDDSNLFFALLSKQDYMPLVPKDMYTIIIGNPDAEHTLTMVSNPFCQPCSKTHKVIEGLLEYNENLNCQVIFAASNVENDKRGIVARTILSMPIGQQAKALHFWFENEERNVEKWQIKLGFTENKTSQKIIEQHQIWCDKAKVSETPTLYLDGYKVPDLYRLEDLKWMLRNMAQFVV